MIQCFYVLQKLNNQAIYLKMLNKRTIPFSPILYLDLLVKRVIWRKFDSNRKDTFSQVSSSESHLIFLLDFLHEFFLSFFAFDICGKSLILSTTSIVNVSSNGSSSSLLKISNYD